MLRRTLGFVFALFAATVGYSAAEADLLVAYDQTYTASVGGHANVQVLAANAVAGSNAINERCGTGARVRIVGYHEAAQNSYQRTSKGGFVNWMASYDSRLSDVVDAGNARGADLITFLCVSTSDGAAAVAQQPGRFSCFDPGQFWSTVVAHELAGHNYGCDHRGGRESPKTVMMHNYCGGGAQGYYSNANMWLNGSRLLGEGSCLGDAVNGGDNSLLISTTAQGVADRFARVVAAPRLDRVVRRWSFAAPAGSAPAGSTVLDSVSGASAATVAGSGALFTGSGLRLPGGAGGSGAAYVQLPAGVLSGLSEVTIEIWAAPLSSQTWSRLLDINNGTANYLTLSTATAAGLGAQRFESVVGGATVSRDSGLPTTSGVLRHYAITYASIPAGGGRWTWYRDGDAVAWLDVAYPLSSVPDVNVWLGRSAFSADALAHCDYAEVRISDVALTRDQVLAHQALGPYHAASSVYLTADDPLGQASFLAAGRWSDGLAPSSAKSYETANFRLRTPADSVSRAFAGQSLKLSGGGLVWKGTTSATLTMPDLVLTGSPELLHAGSGTWNLAGAMQVAAESAMIRGANGPIVVSAALSGSRPLQLVNNTITLTGNNAAYTGRMLVGDGRATTLAIDSEARLGTAPTALVKDQLSFNRGTLQIAGVQALDDATRGVFFDVNGGVFQVATGGVLTLSSPLSTPDLGSGVVAGALRKSGPGTLILASPGTTFRGIVHVDSGAASGDDGILRVAHPQTLAAAAAPIFINNTANASSRLQLDATAGAIVLPRISLAGRNGSVPAVQSLNGLNQIGGLGMVAGGANYVVQSDAGRLTIIGGVSAEVAGTRTLTLQGAGDIAITGSITDGSADVLGLLKLGVGTLTLSGANTHDGPTTVQAGALRLDGSLVTAGTLGIASGATLSGVGTTNATTAVLGLHAPGSAANTTGAQTFTGSLAYGSAARIDWNLTSDTVALGGFNRVSAQSVTVSNGASVDLTFARAGSTVDFRQSFWTQIRVWPVLTTASLNGRFALGTVGPDSGGRDVATYGSFHLQQGESGVQVVFYPLGATAPATPGGLVATASSGAVALTWTPSSGAVVYIVRRSSDGGASYQIVTEEVTGTSYTDATVSNGVTYSYVVSAANAFGESATTTAAAAAPRAPSVVRKADNALALDQPASWTGVVRPTAWDTAQWAGLSGANTIALGSSMGLRGLAVGATGGPVSITSGQTLTLGTGGIDLAGATQNLSMANALSLVAGAQTWTVAAGRTAAHTGVLSRIPGATLLVDKTVHTGLVTASSPTLVNSLVGPWAVVAGSGLAANNSASGYTYATRNAGGAVTPYTTATALTATTAWGGMPSGGSGTINYDLSSAGVLGATGLARNIHTLRYTGSGARQRGNVGSDLFTLNGLMNAGSGALTLGREGANITDDFSFGILFGSTNELVLAPMTADLILYSFIKNGSSGAGVVTVAGRQGLTLAGPNTFTGGLHLNSGTLRLAHDSALGTGTLRIHGGDIRSSGGVRTIANSVVLDGAFTLGRDTHISGPITLADDVVVTSANPDAQTAAVSTLSGAVSGTRGLTFAEGLNPTGVILLSGANTYAGGTTVESGSLRLGHTSALGMATGNLTVNGGSLDLNAFSPTVGRLSGSGGVISTLTAGVATLTTRTSADSTYAGVLQNGAAVQTLALTKQGPGTLTLAGPNTYTGPTTVNAGGLQVTGSLGTSAVTVSAGAVLSGPGVLGGPVSITSGAVHAPGSPVGAQTVAGALAYADGARLRWTLIDHADSDAAASRVVASHVTITAGARVDLRFNAPGSMVDFTSAYWSEPRSWPILNTTVRTGDFSLGEISTDALGRPVDERGAFTLRTTSAGVWLDYAPTLVATPAATWRARYFGADWATRPDAVDTADPDGDGVSNLLERAFAGDPLVSDARLHAPVADLPALSITYRQARAATDLSFIVEESTDLAGPWSTASGQTDVASEADDYRVLRHVRPTAGAARLFLRVKVIAP